ncbi:MAG: hypothetical protein NTU41_08400, partial [Chloroflexi bacterium]|nr:hypothetical protein [Chloroflexota bacterium]
LGTSTKSQLGAVSHGSCGYAPELSRARHSSQLRWWFLAPKSRILTEEGGHQRLFMVAPILRLQGGGAAFQA